MPLKIFSNCFTISGAIWLRLADSPKDVAMIPVDSFTLVTSGIEVMCEKIFLCLTWSSIFVFSGVK